MSKACVFTSATLSIGEDPKIRYFRNRVGAEEARAALIESPFDFKKQMKLYLLKKMPQPSEPGYLDQLEHWITHFIDLSIGRAFILFTSYSQMTSLADKLDTLVGLFLAGDWIGTRLPATIEAAVRSGHLAAEAALPRCVR